MKSDLKILEKDLSYKLYGIFLKIGKEYGCNFKEKIYQIACEEELHRQKISFARKPEVEVFSVNDKKIGLCIPDLLVENKIIIEIKAMKG